MDLLLMRWPSGLTFLLVASLVLLIPLFVIVLVVRRMTRSDSGSMAKPRDRTPGWKADPIGTGERFFDGERWTEESRP